MSRRDKPADRSVLMAFGALIMAAAFGLSAWLEGDLSLSEGGAPNAAPEAEAIAAQSTPAPRAASDRRYAPAPAPFDYYVLALSWSPSFCERNPDGDQCGQGRRFTLHGLWPQYEDGYPQDCATDANRRVPGSLLREYQDLTGSRGLLAHQWRKHGSCTGLSAEAYFDASRAAVERVAVPEPLAKASRDARLDPRVVETAFMTANPGFERDGVTITCRSGDLAEVRVCLDLSLNPRRCGADVRADCRSRMVDLPAPR
ncbi:MAG: ribonuclease T2 [Pseudomonadota bacterium]